MIDIHSHLIPEFDDGPKSFDESLKMLQIAEEQGITDVFATSHFQEIIPPQMEEDYLVKLEELQNRAAAMDLTVNIHSGGELFYHEQLEETIKQHKVTTLGNWGQYVLFEFPMYLMPDGGENILFRLSAANYIPVVAHPERYSMVIRKPKKVVELLKFGGLIQMNGGSILGHFGKDIQKVSLYLLKNKLVQFIASDAHTVKGRTFVLKNVYDFLEDEISEEYLEELLILNPRKIINREVVEKPELPESEPESGFLSRLRNRFKVSDSS